MHRTSLIAAALVAVGLSSACSGTSDGRPVRAVGVVSGAPATPLAGPVPDVHTPVRLDVRAVPVRSVSVADVAVEVGARWTSKELDARLIVRDARTGAWGRIMLPERSGMALELLDLSPDGRELLFTDETAGSTDRLCLLDIATGSQRWFDTDPGTYGAGVLATISPDGRSIGTVLVATDPLHPDAEDSSLSVVSIIDIATGRSQRLFAAEGGWGGSSGVAWSPDGQLLAATYDAAPTTSDPEDEFSTVVLDRSGRMIRRITGTDPSLATPTNGAWLDKTHLLCFLDSGVAPVDVGNGSVGAVVSTGELTARVGNRLVRVGEQSTSEALNYETTTLDGGGRRPWLTLVGTTGEGTVRFA